MSSQLKPKKSKVQYAILDLFRVIAVSIVLISHIGTMGFFGIQNFYWVSPGGIAVTIFLVLSGIVLGLNHGNKKIHFVTFFKRRILRIYPTYYTASAVAFIIYIFQDNFSCTKCTVPHFLATASGYYAYLGEWGGPFLATSWFIGLIVTLYIFFPFIAKHIKKRPHITIILLLVMSVTSRIIIGSYDIFPNRPLDWFPLNRVFEFSLGIYLSHVVKKDFLLCINKYKKTAVSLAFLGKLSFPLFLIHFPLLYLINTFSVFVGHRVAIVLYLAISLFVSWLIFIVANTITQKLLKIITPKKPRIT